MQRRSIIIVWSRDGGGSISSRSSIISETFESATPDAVMTTTPEGHTD